MNYHLTNQWWKQLLVAALRTHYGLISFLLDEQLKTQKALNNRCIYWYAVTKCHIMHFFSYVELMYYTTFNYFPCYYPFHQYYVSRTIVALSLDFYLTHFALRCVLSFLWSIYRLQLYYFCSLLFLFSLCLFGFTLLRQLWSNLWHRRVLPHHFRCWIHDLLWFPCRTPSCLCLCGAICWTCSARSRGSLKTST